MEGVGLGAKRIYDELISVERGGTTLGVLFGRKGFNERTYEPTHSCLRPNSDIVLLPSRTKFRNEVRQEYGRSMASKSNF